MFSRTLTSLNTSLNSPGGECNIKSETIRTFSWSGITASPSAAILPFPLAHTLRRCRRRHHRYHHRCRCQKRGYGAVVTDGVGLCLVSLDRDSASRLVAPLAAVPIYRVMRSGKLALPRASVFPRREEEEGRKRKSSLSRKYNHPPRSRSCVLLSILLPSQD